MYRLVSSLFAIALVSAPLAAQAKTLYVDGTIGNDATSYAANSASSPWRTIGRAAWGSTNRSSPNGGEAARAGDVVRIAAGTYSTVGLNHRWMVAYQPENSGTASSPIRFEAVGIVNLVYSSGGGPMIGSDGKHYIQWSGFTINEATAPTVPDTGPVLFSETTGGSLENCTLIGNPNWTSRVGDNYDGVRLNGSTGQWIVNNRITGYGGQSGDENHAAIKTYFVRDAVIEHNDISNSGSGIYLKGNNQASPVVTRLTIRFNRFTGNTEGIRILLIPSTEAQPNLIYQNIFRSNRMGINIQVFDRGLADPRHAKIINNVFADNQWGFYVGGSLGLVPNSGHVFWNNIVTGGDRGLFSYHPISIYTDSLVDVEHNVYSGSSAFAEVNAVAYTFSSWRSATGQDSAAPASVQSSPLFVNAGAGDFRLQAGSPAMGLGRARYGIGGADGAVVPAGAYITGNEVIGLSSGVVPPTLTPPEAPTNVRVVR